MLTLLAGTIGVLFPRVLLLSGAPFASASIFLAAATAGLGYGIYTLVRSYVGYMYEGLPLAGPLFEHRKALREYYLAKDGSPEEGEREFESLIDERRIAAATRNAQHNIRRGAFLHKANIAIVISALLLSVAAVPSILYVPKEDSPVRVQIISAPEAIHDGRQQPTTRDERVSGDARPKASVDSARRDSSAEARRSSER